MTDKEIIALVESKLPQELTLDEIELIRERMRTSATVRQALSQQLELDQYLAGVIGKVELTPEKVLASGGARARQRGGVLAWMGWSVCLLLVVFVTGMLAWPLLAPPGPHPHDLADADANPQKAGIEGAIAGPLEQPGATANNTDAADVIKNLPRVIDPHVGPVGFQPSPDNGGGLKVSGNKIELTASAFVQSKNVVVDRDKWGAKVDGGVIHSTERKAFLAYEFPVTTAGVYRLELRYAAAEASPTRIAINGAMVKQDGTNQTTGGWLAESQKEFIEGTFPLKAGLNKLRLEAYTKLPHLSLIRFTLDQTSVAKAPNLGHPWRADSQLGGPPRSMEEIALDGFDTLGSAPSQDDAKKWFSSIQGNISLRDFNGMRLPVLDGVNRFNAPLSEDAVLRLSLFENQWLTLHFWRGKTGLTLRMQPDKGVLVAYRVDRTQNANPPLRSLAATDWDRNYRTNPSQMPMRLDLRFRKGLFVVSRGDVELLRAPYEGLPDEVLFDGHCLIRGLGLVRTTSELAPEPAPKAIAQDYPRPADLNWVTELPKEIELVKLPDGAVELKSQQSPQAGWAAFALPDGGLGLREMIVEVDDVTPGCHVGLGADKGQPRNTVGFFKDNGNAGLSFRFSGWGDNAMDNGTDYNGGRNSGYASKHQWLKFVGGAGIKLCTSLDGVHWTPWISPVDNVDARLTHFSMYLAQNNQPRSIKIRRITLRKLETIESLAGPELLAKAPLISANDLNTWNAEVAKQQPPGTAKNAWRRACAIKTIAAGGSGDPINRLIDQLLNEVMAAARPVDEQLARLDEFALLMDVGRNAEFAQKFMHRYVELGERLMREGSDKPWTTTFRAIAYSPMSCEFNYGARIDRLARAQLLEAIYKNRLPDVKTTLASLRVNNVQDPLLNFAGDWLARQGETDIGFDRPQQGRAYKPAAHPLVEELNKEGFNLLGDFMAALESKAYRDACQIVTSTEGADSLGLWPDPRDPQLLMSVNGAIDAALRSDGELRQTMMKEFAPLGMVEVKQAIGQADSAAVAAVVTRFRGTQAAALASAWLGDRAMSTGDFSKARGYYAEAQRIGGLPDAGSIAARDRLAAAMMGQESGQPVTVAVHMGEVQVAAADFEKLVGEMIRSHGSKDAAGGAPVAQPPQNAPAPSGFDLREIGKIDGDTGHNPGDWNPTNPQHDQRTPFVTFERDKSRFFISDNPDEPVYRPLDWAGRQVATAVDGDWLYVSNRFQIAAYNLKDGGRKWRTELGGEHSFAHEWSLTPMRPLIVGKRIYCRQLVNWDNSLPELVALDKDTGAKLWSAPTRMPGRKVISDPIWTSRGLVAVTLSRGDRSNNIYLSTFNPATGEVAGMERLATVRDTWWLQRTCQLSQVGSDYVIVFGGAVLSCDSSGKTRWVRRQEWIAPQEDLDWARHYQQPALAWKNRLLVQQPGVAAIECVDKDTGALVWRKVVPGLQRMSGLVDDKLIVQSQSGFVGLSAEKGDTLWNHLAGDLLEGQLCGGPGGFMYGRREKAPDGQLRPVLVWLDPQSGQTKGSFALEPLKHNFPVFGPLTAAPGRLIAFAAGGENEAQRTLFELVPKGAAQTARNQADATPIALNEGLKR